MENTTKEPEDRMQKFFAEEKQKTLRRYQILNELSQKGKVLFTGSSLMEQFPLNEMLMTEGITLTAYNRGIGGFTTDDMKQVAEAIALAVTDEEAKKAEAMEIVKALTDAHPLY